MGDYFPLANKDIVFRQAEEEEALLFNPETGVIKVLNAMGVFIWKLCDGKHASIDIVNKILENFKGVTKEKARDDVINFLDELKSMNLISTKSHK